MYQRVGLLCVYWMANLSTVTGEIAVKYSAILKQRCNYASITSE